MGPEFLYATRVGARPRGALQPDSLREVFWVGEVGEVGRQAETDVLPYGSSSSDHCPISLFFSDKIAILQHDVLAHVSRWRREAPWIADKAAERLPRLSHILPLRLTRSRGLPRPSSPPRPQRHEHADPARVPGVVALPGRDRRELLRRGPARAGEERDQPAAPSGAPSPWPPGCQGPRARRPPRLPLGSNSVNIWPPPSANVAISTADKRHPGRSALQRSPTGGGTSRWSIRRDHDAPHNGWMGPAPPAPSNPSLGVDCRDYRGLPARAGR